MSSSALPSRKRRKKLARPAQNKLPGFLILLGLICIGSAVAIVFLTFYPVLKAEVSYIVRTIPSMTSFRAATRPQNEPGTPVDEDFGILIPKIGANAKIIADVDPNNSKEYQQALTRGVAHAKGTAYPGQVGNIFLFSHSSTDFFVASQFNSVFYLIHRLEKGDTIDLYYQKQKFTYTVTDKKTVDPKDVSYLSPISDIPTLTLMTCWPPGTTLKRLIVLASITTN